MHEQRQQGEEGCTLDTGVSDGGDANVPEGVPARPGGEKARNGCAVGDGMQQVGGGKRDADEEDARDEEDAQRIPDQGRLQVQPAQQPEGARRLLGDLHR